MHIAVIGSGYVGLVTGTCFAEFGDDVTCVDVDAEKIARLARGEITVYEPGLNQLVRKNLQAGRLRFTTDIGSATEQSLVVFLAVGTPPKADGSADLTYLEGAELIKYAANAFLATKISFVNEIANLCEKVGCDVHEVARAIGMDRRIGSKFLHPGPGFGGSCFPKDTRALAAIGREFSSPMRIVDAVVEVNEQQRLSMVPKIETLAGGLQGKRIAVLGLAFKPETDDMRDAPSVEIIRGLIHRGATVSAYDPVAREEAQKILPNIEFAKDEYVAAAGAAVLVFMTEWNQFRALDMERIRSLMRVPRIADLRNIYEPADIRNLGFEYVGVGR